MLLTRLFPLVVFLAIPFVANADEAGVAIDSAVQREDDTTLARRNTPEDPTDAMRDLQSNGVRNQSAAFGRWGNQPGRYSTWNNHSNRLIPVYTFGMSLGSWREAGSPYASNLRLETLYGEVPPQTLDTEATYYDQTQVHDLMQLAIRNGKRHVIVFVFDGMDWQTTRAAAIYHTGRDQYNSGRGSGLSFQDYRKTVTDFAFVVTSPAAGGAKPDIDSQTIQPRNEITGGFNAQRAGPMPWQEPTESRYPIGLDRELRHEVTDSAASATSLFAGIKTYNGAINVDVTGKHVEPIARELQANGFRVGIVTSVPVSHATPASAYANNVTRKDYQDISRDMIGVPSSSHRSSPLPGLDVVLGGGFGEGSGKPDLQGQNFLAGNTYLHESDVEHAKDRYVFATRIKGRTGVDVLHEATQTAIESGKRLLGLFGVKGGHLPFRTADGDYQPTFDVRGAEQYSEADLSENPTLAEMTESALAVLSAPATTDDQDVSPAQASRFWLLVEAGDVDWANHANNIDNSIGAVISGADAFTAATDWVEAADAWDDTLIIVTSDHGHFLVLEDTSIIANATQ
ncbi:MAG: alkaline phosphatase [Planctomycetota bacterium]